MHRIILRRKLLALIAGGCTMALVPGCGSPSRAYAPSARSARDSLDAALSVWRKGGKADQLATASPAIHTVDYQWQARQVLESYEILEEQPGGGDAEKRYGVLLKFKKPIGEKRVQYIIIGREPVWVFRDEDYTRTSDMADNPRPGRRRRP
jgi:hypothetical protein